MKKILLIGLSTFLLAATASAVDEHHPEQKASAPASTATAQKNQPDWQIRQMDDMMKRMQAMHDKLAAARSPQERQRLMDEHGKVMQDGMQLMKDMQAMGRTGTNPHGTPPARMMMDPETMHKRMDMMQMMMEMMMDRDPAMARRAR